MAHVLIVGITESGKTTLARRLAASYKRQGYTILVLDPLRDPRWNADFITSDPQHFLEVFWKSRRCMVFMDEGGESVGRYDLAMQKTATRGRHMGHSCHYIAQNAVQIAPIIRDQCTHLFLFNSPMRSCKALAEEFNRPELLNGVNFKQGEYIHAVKFGKLQKFGGQDVSVNGRGRTVADGHRSVGSEQRGNQRADQAGQESDGSDSGTSAGQG